MESRILNNAPLKELTTKNDYLNLLDRVNTIKYFFENPEIFLKENKMFALYGNWGSGKSTIFNHLSTKIEASHYKCIIFESWQFEKDENLTLSLFSKMMEESGINSLDIFSQGVFRFLKSFGKGLTIRIPGLSISGNTIISEYEESYKALEDSISGPESYYRSELEFKEKFRKLEEEILKKIKC